MKRIAVAVNAAGISIMAAAGLLLCSAGVGVGSRVVVFLSGLTLFVAGGAYAASRERYR